MVASTWRTQPHQALLPPLMRAPRTPRLELSAEFDNSEAQSDTLALLSASTQRYCVILTSRSQSPGRLCSARRGAERPPPPPSRAKPSSFPTRTSPKLPPLGFLSPYFLLEGALPPLRPLISFPASLIQHPDLPCIYV